MKKLILTAVTVLSLTATAFATDGIKRVNHKVLKQFQTQYAEASDVNWNVTADYVKASFLHEDAKVEAFYSMDGEFIGQSSAATLQNLPRKAAKEISSKYANYIVTEVIEFTTSTELNYFISLKSNGERVVLKVTTSGQISVQKTK